MVAECHQDFLFMYVRDLKKTGSSQLDLVKPTQVLLLYSYFMSQNRICRFFSQVSDFYFIGVEEIK